MVRVTGRSRSRSCPIHRRPWNWGAIAAIALYQRYLSPRKGFACAHRIAHGGDSCSQYVKRLVASEGIFTAMMLAPKRFRDCRDAYHFLRMSQGHSPSHCDRPSRWRRFYDRWCLNFSCGDGDPNSDCDICSSFEGCDVGSCCEGCDLGGVDCCG